MMLSDKEMQITKLTKTRSFETFVPPTGREIESQMSMETSQLSDSRHVVALPHHGRGHINPMLNLCRRLATRSSNLLITFIVTEEWFGLLSSASSLPLPPNMLLRSIPNVLPSEKVRGSDFGAFFQAAMTEMEGPVEELLGGEGVDAIIADSVLQWAPAIAGRRGVPVYSLFTQSAAVFLALHRPGELIAAGQSDIDFSGEGNECLKYTPQLFIKSVSDDERIPRRFIQLLSWSYTAQGLLFSSFTDLESHTFTLLRSKLAVPIYPVGPLIPYEVEHINSSKPSYYQWLDSQQEGSVLFISLGSFLPLSGDQITEIAIGLQISSVHFLWAVRGETERIDELSGGNGLVVPWCDQLSVLCHPSVGGFLSHCGWNSTMEAVYAGVPVLTFPLIWDQYPNSLMVVEDWKIGFALKKGGEASDVVGREEIAKGVRKLMCIDSEDGKEARSRARELREMCCEALKEKGSSSVDVDAFVQELLQK